MALKHTELCDNCDKPTLPDGAPRGEWEGIRLAVTPEGIGNPHRRADLPGRYPTPIYQSDTIDITISHQSKTFAGVSGQGDGMVLPGIVCGPACFREWMAVQIDKVVANWPGKEA